MLNKKIEYFVTLAECLSFTQAAAVHSVSQTAISQYIASLEGQLQVRLFKWESACTNPDIRRISSPVS